MNSPADLVDSGERDRRHLPRVGIDLELDDVAGPSVAAVGVAPIAGVVPAHAGRTLILLRDDERSVSAEILAGRQRAETRAHVLGAALEDAADDHARARRDGRPAVRHFPGVCRVHLDAVVRQAERLRNDLRVHRPRPLTNLGAGDENPGAAFGQRERCLRSELDLPGAGKS